ncbi:hypothetical protein [Spirosoma sordidisoli]|uniref:Uncharacterized protein n=1 Tax=Spirosoma sordidisoli TaxID=2502893 RepID=A0A4Q2UKR3_9BACT|nr:hypothetical protein [Spirosoma sordidisoli]RYC69816.1 hypothetical protein EQG79_14580 [Spirosoma sordidisoli]
MNNFVNATTRFGLRCRKALLLLVALALATLGALFTPADAQVLPPVLPMVNQQPFPYPTGVALDNSTYAAVKAKVRAADSLRTHAEARIQALTLEITATRGALADRDRLSRHDSLQTARLRGRLRQVETELGVVKQELERANGTIARVVATLPRRLRRLLARLADPDQTYSTLVTYLDTLRVRKWTFGGAGCALGFVLGLTLLL